MVIEFLTFAVDECDRDEWMRFEELTWSRFLERQPGFVRKQMWHERGKPNEVHAMIIWADDASWAAVPVDEQAEVDATMGPWFRPCVLRTYDILRDS